MCPVEVSSRRTEHDSYVTLIASVSAEAMTTEATMVDVRTMETTTVEATMKDTSEGMEGQKGLRFVDWKQSNGMDETKPQLDFGLGRPRDFASWSV